MKKYKTALTIAGSDSSGGAGIQADIKTFGALGCYGMSVITALTAQNTKGVEGVLPISAKFVESQLDSIFSDIKVNAAKTGMLFSSDIIKVVAKYFSKLRIPLVVDPVMIAKSGDLLLKKSAINSLRKELLPVATLVTPNLDEACYLLKRSIKSEQEMEVAAKDICDFGSKAVLIKGGHLSSKESNDCLYVKKSNKFYWFKSKRIVTKNNHGTGCTLSAAITSFLAQGYKIEEAVFGAKNYITEALKAGKNYKLGSGKGPVSHFYFWGQFLGSTDRT